MIIGSKARDIPAMVLVLKRSCNGAGPEPLLQWLLHAQPFPSQQHPTQTIDVHSSRHV